MQESSLAQETETEDPLPVAEVHATPDYSAQAPAAPPSEKSKSLLSDLMGDGDKSSGVWE